MRSDLIELHAPGRDHHPRLAQRIKQLASKALSAELVMEALDIAVLPRATRIDVEGFDTRFSQPRLKGLSNEFGTVITANVAGGTMELDKFPHHLQHLARTNVAGHMQGVNLTGVFIYHAQHSVRTSLDRGVMNEVPGPDMAAVNRFLWKTPGGYASTALFLFGRRHLQTLLATHLTHSLTADSQPAVAHQPTHLVRTELSMFNAQLHDGLVDFLLSDAGKLWTVSQCGSVKAKMAGCLTLAAAFFSYSVPRQLTAVRRA
jgi:hypothetical protein